MFQQSTEEDSKVDYHVFRSQYWPRFPQGLTKGLSKLLRTTRRYCGHSSSTFLDPALVWSEFLGVISGSEGSLVSNDGYMNRNAYEQLSHRTQATFASQRRRVYELFQAYVGRKRTLEGYDVADRCAPSHGCLFPSLTFFAERMLSCKLYRPMDRFRGFLSTICVYRSTQIYTADPYNNFVARYCDESQDNLLIDVKCMDSPCQNPPPY